MYINNPFGDDIAELQEKNAPIRVGKRIREAGKIMPPLCRRVISAPLSGLMQTVSNSMKTAFGNRRWRC